MADQGAGREESGCDDEGTGGERTGKFHRASVEKGWRRGKFSVSGLGCGGGRRCRMTESRATRCALIVGKLGFGEIAPCFVAGIRYFQRSRQRG
jgi:hypothetical protein